MAVREGQSGSGWQSGGGAVIVVGGCQEGGAVR